MRNKIVNTTLTAMLAVGIGSAGTEAAASNQANTMPKVPKGMEKCYGIAKAGLNDCGTATNSGCAGSATMDGQVSAWIYLPRGTCAKIVGGSIVEPKPEIKAEEKKA